MTLDSNLFDRIRIAGRAQEDPESEGPRCSWAGCDLIGTHRAPLGRGREGQYRLFCLDHVRQYNKSYNYFEGMPDDAVVAFQKASLTGHRPTFPIGTGPRRQGSPIGAGFSGLYDDPFDLVGAPRSSHRSGFEPAEPRRRRPTTPEREAFETLGLSEDNEKAVIKARYKALVKLHHPDANNGDRSSETRLRNVISAYSVLKRGGWV